VGDLGEAFRGEDGNWEGNTIQGIIVRFGNGGGEAFAKLNETREAQNTEVACGVIIKEEDFGHGRIGRGGLVVAATGDFLKNLFYISAGHIGFG